MLTLLNLLFSQSFFFTSTQSCKLTPVIVRDFILGQIKNNQVNPAAECKKFVQETLAKIEKEKKKNGIRKHMIPNSCLEYRVLLVIILILFDDFVKKIHFYFIFIGVVH